MPPPNTAEHVLFDPETMASHGPVETHQSRDTNASESREIESQFTTGVALRRRGRTVGLTQGRASSSVRREGGL